MTSPSMHPGTADPDRLINRSPEARIVRDPGPPVGSKFAEVAPPSRPPVLNALDAVSAELDQLERALSDLGEFTYPLQRDTDSDRATPATPRPGGGTSPVEDHAYTQAFRVEAATRQVRALLDRLGA